MNKIERILALSLLVVAVGLGGFRFYSVFINGTKLLPTEGGVYTEAIAGEVKFLNPITAQNDAEQSTMRLIFSGLVKVTDQNTILPDLAESWEVSADGKRYVFHMRHDALFSDGNPVTAADVAFTIASIEDNDTMSPLQKTWANVIVETPDDYTLQLTLPTVYGPFIYNCTFGVLPAHLTSDEFAKTIVGSGPYSYRKFKKAKDSTKITEIELAKNPFYYGEKPYIKTLKLRYFDDKVTAKSEYEKDSSINSLYGVSTEVGQKLDFASSRRLGLVANLRNQKMQDGTLRQAVFQGTALATNTKVSLTALDVPLQHEQAEKIKESLKAANIDLEINYLVAAKFQEAITNKSYELILYVFDFGYDRDPYVFWHSSQANALNLSGWNNKDTDILLEDARMMTDTAARNQKYDQFGTTITAQNLVKYYEPVLYNFSIKGNIKGVSPVIGTQPYSRYFGMSQWFITEVRTGK